MVKQNIVKWVAIVLLIQILFFYLIKYFLKENFIEDRKVFYISLFISLVIICIIIYCEKKVKSDAKKEHMTNTETDTNTSTDTVVVDEAADEIDFEVEETNTDPLLSTLSTTNYSPVNISGIENETIMNDLEFLRRQVRDEKAAREKAEQLLNELKTKKKYSGDADMNEPKKLDKVTENPFIARNEEIWRKREEPTTTSCISSSYNLAENHKNIEKYYNENKTESKK